jgi:hypothetical protein
MKVTEITVDFEKHIVMHDNHSGRQV